MFVRLERTEHGVTIRTLFRRGASAGAAGRSLTATPRWPPPWCWAALPRPPLQMYKQLQLYTVETLSESTLQSRYRISIKCKKNIAVFKIHVLPHDVLGSPISYFFILSYTLTLFYTLK